MSRNTHQHDDSRRVFVNKMAYAVPLILSLKAEPAFASNGSAKGSTGGDGDERRGRDEDGDEDGDSQGGDH